MPTRIIRRCATSPVVWPSHIHPVLQRVYGARQVRDSTELECTLERLPPPQLLHGMEAAVHLLADALREQRRILVVADFDADGATSCAVALRALRAMGARAVDYMVPNRFRDGYGLTPEIVAQALTREPALIVTVDNGISSMDGVAAAKAHGIRVLITDHHLPGAQLPAADAIVNPNQPGDVFPSKALAGVGVIFYVMLGLRAHLRDSGWFAQQSLEPPNLARLLDVVALGTVADVVALDSINRIFVAQGLARIRAGQCCAAITALLHVAGRAPERISATDLGFTIGPRLNAAGRLEDMSLGIECLLEDNATTARAQAKRLDELNRERRAIEDEMKAQALDHLEEFRWDEELPAGLCLYHDDWHQGVIGILASRVKELYHRPVICFAPVSGDEIKGSARSVQGLHIRDALDSIAARHPKLLKKFGGHAMAAGLTLPRKYYAEFSLAFAEEAARHLSAEDLQGVIYSDGELAPADIALPLATAIVQGGPWGQGFPEPIFDGLFHVTQQRIVGERHIKMALQSPYDARRIEAIAFNGVEDDYWHPRAERVHLAYRLDVNEYRGARTPQLIVEHLQVR